MAALSMFAIAALTLDYTRLHAPEIAYYMPSTFALAFGVEISLRLLTKRVVTRHIVDLFNIKT